MDDLLISGDIDDKMVEAVFDKLNGVAKKESLLSIYINSFGGTVKCATAIRNIIRMYYSTTQIETVNLGVCGSAAMSIYLLGGTRHCHSDTYFFDHPTSAPGVNLEQTNIQYYNLSEQDMIINNKKYYSEAGAKYHGHKLKIEYISPQDALESGICHKIIESEDVQ